MNDSAVGAADAQEAVADHSSMWSKFKDLAQPGTRRSFALLGLGAIAGLFIAGWGLFTAKGTLTHNLPPENVARVNQRAIYRSDFVEQTQTQYGVPFERTTLEQRRQVLGDMIDEELLVQRGIAVDLPASDPDVRAALVSGVELQMYADVLARQPTEDELRAYYEQHRDRYLSSGSMQLRDLLLNVGSGRDDALRRAQAAVVELRRGAVLDDDFVARHGLRDSGRMQQGGKIDLGEVLDFAVEAKLGGPIYALARTMQTGDVSDPIPLADGLHIVVMKQRRTPQALTFEAVSKSVAGDMKREARTKVRSATLGYLRGKADILTTGEP